MMLWARGTPHLVDALTRGASVYRDKRRIEVPGRSAGEVGRQQHAAARTVQGLAKIVSTIFAKSKNKARQRRALKMRGIIQGVSIRGFQGR